MALDVLWHATPSLSGNAMVLATAEWSPALADLRALIAERDQLQQSLQDAESEAKGADAMIAALQGQAEALAKALDRIADAFERHLADEALKAGEKSIARVCPCWETSIVPARATLAAYRAGERAK